VTLLIPVAMLLADLGRASVSRRRLGPVPLLVTLVVVAGTAPSSWGRIRDGSERAAGLLRVYHEIDRLSHEAPESGGRFAFLLESRAFDSWIRQSFGVERAASIPRLPQPRLGDWRLLPERRREFLESVHFRGFRVYEVEPTGVHPATSGALLPNVSWMPEFSFARSVRAADGPWTQWSCLLRPSFDPGHACVPSSVAAWFSDGDPAPNRASILSLTRRPEGWWIDVEARSRALLVWTGSATFVPGAIDRARRSLETITRLPPAPGTARVDGAAVRTVSVHAAFAGIVLEPGTHQVELHDPMQESR